jgi:hypothetical protein
MARVTAARVHLSTWILISACAPSLPHPPKTRATPDAAIDQPSTIPEAPDVPSRDAMIGNTLGDTPRDAFRETPARLDGPIDDGNRDPGLDTGTRPDSGGNPDGDAGALPAPNPGDLRITELLINPAGTDTNREWIEVVNMTDHAVDLHLLTVADAAGAVAVDAGVLNPRAFLVLGQSLDPARNGGAPVGLSFGNVISLNNGGDLIRLCLGPCAGGVIITEVSWTADLGPAFDGHAAVVGIDAGPPGGADGGLTDAAAATPVFCPADQPFGTAASFGRPGLPDPPCPG